MSALRWSFDFAVRRSLKEFITLKILGLICAHFRARCASPSCADTRAGGNARFEM